MTADHSAQHSPRSDSRKVDHYAQHDPTLRLFSRVYPVAIQSLIIYPQGEQRVLCAEV